MKKAMFGVLLILPLLLGACRTVNFTQASYDRIVGVWVVGDRPAGWHDQKYWFDADKSFTIFYDTLDPYEGTVLGVDDANILVEGATGKTPEKMTMCYLLDAAGTSMQLGWYDGFIPKYYLKFTKQ